MRNVIGVAVSAAVVLYIAGAFVAYSASPAEWEPHSRSVLAFVWAAVVGFAFVHFLDTRD